MLTMPDGQKVEFPVLLDSSGAKFIDVRAPPAAARCSVALLLCCCWRCSFLCAFLAAGHAARIPCWDVVHAPRPHVGPPAASLPAPRSLLPADPQAPALVRRRAAAAAGGGPALFGRTEHCRCTRPARARLASPLAAARRGPHARACCALAPTPCLPLFPLPLSPRPSRSTGMCTFDPGFGSTAACESSITFIDGNKGVLLYRGCVEGAAVPQGTESLGGMWLVVGFWGAAASSPMRIV